MSKVLIKYSACWADEFDCEGFAVLEKQVWSDNCEKVKKIFSKRGDVEVYFGTNEAFIFDSYEDWVRNFEVEDISDDDALILSKLFGDNRSTFDFGTGSHIVDLSGYFQEVDEDDLDDEETGNGDNFDYGVKG